MAKRGFEQQSLSKNPGIFPVSISSLRGFDILRLFSAQLAELAALPHLSSQDNETFGWTSPLLAEVVPCSNIGDYFKRLEKGVQERESIAHD